MFIVDKRLIFYPLNASGRALRARSKLLRKIFFDGKSCSTLSLSRASPMLESSFSFSSSKDFEYFHFPEEVSARCLIRVLNLCSRTLTSLCSHQCGFTIEATRCFSSLVSGSRMEVSFAGHWIVLRRRHSQWKVPPSGSLPLGTIIHLLSTTNHLADPLLPGTSSSLRILK